MELLQKRPDLIEFVESVAYDERIDECVITDVRINQKGDGYLSQIFTITVEDKHTKKRLHLVLKSAFTDQKVRQLAPIRQAFLNEIYFYTQIEPEFGKIEIEHSIPHTRFFPKCYKVIFQNQREVLCLENLKAMNFEAFDKNKFLDEEHVNFIFKTYGRFHAYTFIFKEQEPEEYERIVRKLYNIFLEFVHNPEGNFTTYLRSFNSLVEQSLIPGEDDEIRKKYEKFLGDGIINAFCQATTDVDRYSTILHGDCWSNNMLFKYESTEDGRKIVDMRLLDMQIVKAGSPVCDLSFCFYSGVNKDLYGNLDKYLKTYYESFSSFLRQFGSDPEKVFPFKVLKEHWKKYAAFGMIMSFAVFKIKCTNTEDVIDLTDIDSGKEVDENSFLEMKFDDEDFKERAKNLLYHLSDIDVL